MDDHMHYIYTGPESVAALAKLCLESRSALACSCLPSVIFFFPIFLLLLFFFFFLMILADGRVLEKDLKS